MLLAIVRMPIKKTEISGTCAMWKQGRLNQLLKKLHNNSIEFLKIREKHRIQNYATERLFEESKFSSSQSSLSHRFLTRLDSNYGQIISRLRNYIKGVFSNKIANHPNE